MYHQTNGVMSCPWGKDCTTRVKHKVAKRTTVDSCLHEKIAAVILTPSTFTYYPFFLAKLIIGSDVDDEEIINEEQAEPTSSSSSKINSYYLDFKSSS